MIFEINNNAEAEKESQAKLLPTELLRELAPAVFDVDRLSQEADAQLTFSKIERAGLNEDGSLEKYVVRYNSLEKTGYYLTRNTHHSMPNVHKNMLAINKQMPDNTVPKPVAYLEDADAILYEEVPGDNGLAIFDQLSETERLDFFQTIGERIRQLHAIDKKSVVTKNIDDSPQLEHIMQTVNKDTFDIIEERNQNFFERLSSSYEEIVKKERKFMRDSELVVNHGDLHPENVIRDSNSKVGLMDLTDIMVAPRAKDIGGFFEQLRSMLYIHGFTDDEKIEEYQQAFLRGYGDDILVPEEEIRLYRAWQLWRNAMYFASRFEENFDQAEKQLAAAQELL